MSLKFKLIIGIESHIKLNFSKKLFSSFFSNNNIINNNVNNFDLSIPGVLPIFNFKIIKKIILLGIFLKSDIYYISFFFRKSYFYPDVSKNYQITQYKNSIFKGGYILLYNNYLSNPYYKIVNFKQIHIEEDTSKIIYYYNRINLDYNRAGNVLLELVTNPDINDFYESYLYINNLIYLFNFLDLSLCNFEDGNFRFDLNISIRLFDSKNLKYKIELKNINFLNCLLNLINFEFKRLLYIYINGDFFLSETRGYNNFSFNTFLIRFKENNLDYKYFLDPDLPYILIKDFQFNFFLNFFLFFRLFSIYLNYFFNIYEFLFYKNFFYLFLILGFYYLNYIFIWYWIFNSFFFKKWIFKRKINFSFEHLLIILNNLLHNHISFKFSKILFFFIIKRFFFIFFLYKLINYNFLIKNYNYPVLINNLFFCNLNIFHFYIFNKKIINNVISPLISDNFIYYDFLFFFNKKVFIYREMDEWFKSRD